MKCLSPVRLKSFAGFRHNTDGTLYGAQVCNETCVKMTAKNVLT